MVKILGHPVDWMTYLWWKTKSPCVVKIPISSADKVSIASNSIVQVTLKVRRTGDIDRWWDSLDCFQTTRCHIVLTSVYQLGQHVVLVWRAYQLAYRKSHLLKGNNRQYDTTIVSSSVLFTFNNSNSNSNSNNNNNNNNNNNLHNNYYHHHHYFQILFNCAATLNIFGRDYRKIAGEFQSVWIIVLTGDFWVFRSRNFGAHKQLFKAAYIWCAHETRLLLNSWREDVQGKEDIITHS